MKVKAPFLSPLHSSAEWPSPVGDEAWWLERPSDLHNAGLRAGTMLGLGRPRVADTSSQSVPWVQGLSPRP